MSKLSEYRLDSTSSFINDIQDEALPSRTECPADSTHCPSAHWVRTGICFQPHKRDATGHSELTNHDFIQRKKSKEKMFGERLEQAEYLSLSLQASEANHNVHKHNGEY